MEATRRGEVQGSKTWHGQIQRAGKGKVGSGAHPITSLWKRSAKSANVTVARPKNIADSLSLQATRSLHGKSRQQRVRARQDLGRELSSDEVEPITRYPRRTQCTPSEEQARAARYLPT
jgi:hypothetical protein